MINKTMQAAVAALSMLGLAAAAQADESSYRVLKQVSVTGSPAAPVSYRSLPLDRSWANLSSSDVELVRSQYDDLRAHEEPPFPAGGLAQLASELSALQRKQNLSGELQAMINVDASGRVTAVSWQISPNRGSVAGLNEVLERTRFEPATCAHTACAMAFPLHVEFRDTQLAFN
ncbi:hypothetical protein [Nevskia sp.]|uniref:hypothetical protein n=1 Tax=Nevskia sp. TaxID=1929292 RepID=UPI0025E9B42B|nr:hypothetical protein [Nevskia sp.]